MFGGLNQVEASHFKGDEKNLVFYHIHGNDAGQDGQSVGTNFNSENSNFVSNNNGVNHHSDYNWINVDRGEVCTAVFTTNNPDTRVFIGTACSQPDTFFPLRFLEGSGHYNNCGHLFGFWKHSNDCGWNSIRSSYIEDIHVDSGRASDKTHHVLAGYSFGGQAAIAIATSRGNDDIPFAIVWLVDPVGRDISRQNALRDCDLSEPFTLAPCGDFRKFNPQTKNIVFRYQTTDESILPDFLAGLGIGIPIDRFFVPQQNHFSQAGVIDIRKSICNSNPDECHVGITDPSLNGSNEVLAILKQMNVFPTIQTIDTEINELDLINVTISDVPTRWEDVGRMNHTFRYFHEEKILMKDFTPIETLAKVKFGEKAGLPSNQLDGKKTPTPYPMFFNVYDNGFPCADCTDSGANQEASLNSKGGWDKKELTLTVTNSPPKLSVEIITPFEISTTSALEGETCLPETGAHIILSPNIAIDISVLDSIPDMNAGMNYTINWGDGTTDDFDETDSDIPIIFSHTVRKVGDSTITVFAEDKDGGVGEKSMVVHLPDADCDGIQDLVDTIPDEFSDDAEDETNFDGMTDGTIIDRGEQEVSIIDAYYPGTTPSCPDSSVRTFNFASNMCEDPQRICTDGIFNEGTSKCEQDPLCRHPSIGLVSCELPPGSGVIDEPLCFQNPNPTHPDDPKSEFLEYNDDTKKCEADPLCKSGFQFNSISNQCESPPICPPDSTFDPERDQCVENSAFDDSPPGISIGAFTTPDDGTETVKISQEGKVQIQVIEPGPGAPAEVSVCGGSALLRIVSGDVAIVTCSSVTIEGIGGTVEADFQVGCSTHTAFVNAGQILKFDPETLEYTNLGTTDITIRGGFPPILKAGDTQKAGSSCGGTSHEPPTIGKNKAGTKQLVENGFCIDADCFTVTKLFHEEFKLYEMMSGTHTLSTLVYCAQGVQHCNYSAIGIMPYDKDMNDAVWKIEMKGNHLGEWTPVIYDPEGFLGEVTITTQIVSDKFLSVSYTIEFKNKQTPPMKVGVQLRDDKNGVRNFYFNEGVKFNDSDAYPYVETSFEQPLKVEKICINPLPHDRDSCGFELVRDWTQKKAQDLLNDMQNGNYIYDKYVRDRYYD